jgi:hypothetical protein
MTQIKVASLIKDPPRITIARVHNVTAEYYGKKIRINTILTHDSRQEANEYMQIRADYLKKQGYIISKIK